MYSSMPIIISVVLFIGLLINGSKSWIPIIYLGVSMLLTWGLVYFLMPSRNMLSILAFSSVMGIFVLVLSLVTLNIIDELSDTSSINITLLAIVSIATAIVFFVAVGGEVHSWLSVKPSAESVQVVKSKSSEAPTFKRGETPVASSPKTIMNKVHKSMSDVPNSQYYSLGKMQAQFYRGQAVYIIPINFRGYFASKQAHDIIPGYFMISATSTGSTPVFVKKPMKYSNSSYFSKNAFRKLYLKYPEWLVRDSTEPQLEIDDNGVPYYVQTVYKPEQFSHRIDFRDLHVTVLNALNGKMGLYKTTNMPKFIDEGITSDVASEINTYYGKYRYGRFNFSHKGVKEPTGNGTDDGVTPVFNRNGSISYFTDFTNPNGDTDSALGYSMINARTGKMTYYSTKGIMDSSGARKNADQNYRSQRWKTYMPILYNVSGKPTWVLSVLDSTGSFRGYTYLDASDQSVYATGSNATTALDSYRDALASNSASAGNTAGVKTTVFTGKLGRTVLVPQSSGSTKLLAVIDNSPIIFTIDTGQFTDAPLAQKGDKVQIKAQVVKGSHTANANSFKDFDIK